MGVRKAQSENSHLSDQQLALLQDGELPPGKADHLVSCAGCTQRLKDMQRAISAYAQYEQFVHRSISRPAPKPWLDLSILIAGQKETPRIRRRWWPTLATAAGVCLVLTLLVVSYLGDRRSAEQSSRQAGELLARSSELDLRESRPISVRARGKTLIRPAVLASDATDEGSMRDVRAAFENARYSWRDPLNARSFRAWRSQLSRRRDSVSIIQRGDSRSYRVRTETGIGSLKSVSLILRGTNLEPTAGSFEFDGLGAVDVADEAAASTAAPPAKAPAAKQRSAERLAGPEDTLRVLAALNSIGADVGEPIDISADIQQRRIIVRANGLSADRAREVSNVLKNLPRVLLVLDSAGSPAPQHRPSTTERYSTDTPESLRQQVERQFGGALPMQEVTDRVLDESSSALAQAHALQVLAQAFPPNVESKMNAEDHMTLNTLHLSHVIALEQISSKIRTELAPLIKAPSTRGGDVLHSLKDWQAGVPALVKSVEATDELLSRLLAGSYSLATGEEMLRGLPLQIMQLEEAIRLQGLARK